MVNSADEVDSDDEETVVIHRKRNKKESGLGSRKHGRDEPSVKAKKKAKVLVEVKIHINCIHPCVLHFSHATLLSGFLFPARLSMKMEVKDKLQSNERMYVFFILIVFARS